MNFYFAGQTEPIVHWVSWNISESFGQFKDMSTCSVDISCGRQNRCVISWFDVSKNTTVRSSIVNILVFMTFNSSNVTVTVGPTIIRLKGLFD